MKWLWIEWPPALWRGSCERDVGEGHVADGQVKVACGQFGVRERFRPDSGLWVEGLGDGCGGRVQLDTGHLGALRCEPDEGSDTGSRFQDGAPVESEFLHRGPHGLHVGGIGVVGIDGGSAGCVVLGLAQEAAQVFSVPGVFLTAFIEDLEDALRSPTPPSSKRSLFGLCGWPLLGLQRLKYLEGFKVRPYTTPRTGRRQVLLRRRAEPASFGV